MAPLIKTGAGDDSYAPDLKEIPKPDDAADALAIALCHFIRKDSQFDCDRRGMIITSTANEQLNPFVNSANVNIARRRIRSTSKAFVSSARRWHSATHQDLDRRPDLLQSVTAEEALVEITARCIFAGGQPGGICNLGLKENRKVSRPCQTDLGKTVKNQTRRNGLWVVWIRSLTPATWVRSCAPWMRSALKASC